MQLGMPVINLAAGLWKETAELEGGARCSGVYEDHSDAYTEDCQ